MQNKSILKIYGTAFIATILLLFVYIFLNHQFNGNHWQNMQQSKSALKAEYCELDQVTHFFRQTMNTYSNLMYFFLGMIAIVVGLHDRKNIQEENPNVLQQFPVISILFGCCLIYLCLGSSFFHASLTWLGQRADMNGTYSVCLTIIGICLYRFMTDEKPSARLQKIILYSIIYMIVAFVELHLLIPGTILLPSLIILIMVITILNYNKHKDAYNMRLAVLSLLLMIGAFILRTIDVEKIACNPTSFYQGHALWHFFTGMSAFLLYWFYRSENIKV